jgi:hypothetical protein
MKKSVIYAVVASAPYGGECVMRAYSSEEAAKKFADAAASHTLSRPHMRLDYRSAEGLAKASEAFIADLAEWRATNPAHEFGSAEWGSFYIRPMALYSE